MIPSNDSSFPLSGNRLDQPSLHHGVAVATGALRTVVLDGASVGARDGGVVALPAGSAKELDQEGFELPHAAFFAMAAARFAPSFDPTGRAELAMTRKPSLSDLPVASRKMARTFASGIWARAAM